jgi:GxxExxY protein
VLLVFPYRRQVPLPVFYKGHQLDCQYQLDLIVAESLLVELKAADRMHPVHEAQILAYLRLSGLKIGLLMNFNSALLKDGIRRFRM